MAATAARRAAFDCALRIETDSAYADELLHSARLSGLEARERGFVTELLKGSLRHRGELDFLITRRLRRPLASLDPEVLTCLRLGAYQLRFMGGVAAYAAVSESVELVKRARKLSAAALVNAVLRRLPPRQPEAEGARLSHPAWLVKRWRAMLGPDRCQALLLANLRRPATFFRIPRPVGERQALERLRRIGVEAEPTDVSRAYRITAGDVPTARTAVGARLLRFQDINSQRVGGLLEPTAGEPVLDVCAAPGGKARLLAESSPVVAADRHLQRLRLMRRLGATGIRMLAIDAERSLPFTRPFKSVLVDAPCSGTGTLARNPEIKWRLRPSDLRSLARRQRKILNNALDVLAPGGSLVYATCSLEPEENENVVEAAICARPGWPAHRVLSTLPGRDPGDGFQAWRIRRPAS